MRKRNTNTKAQGWPGRLLALLDGLIGRLLKPARVSVALTAASDLSCSKADLIAVNALLRQQLAILRCQVKRPRLTSADRFGLLVLAKWVRS